jgi:hypothetical protein
LSEVAAGFEPLSRGRPVAGHLAYLCTLTALAGLISVFNARSPGAGAWAVLNALLVVVFLIPWLETLGLGRDHSGLARLRLAAPWSIFYALLVAAGVTNYLPTRFGPAAFWLAIGFTSEGAGLVSSVDQTAWRAMLWPVGPWTIAGAAAAAESRARTRPSAANDLDRTWLWFRDAWGVVWAIRVMERFNRSAEANGWPLRLTWTGAVPAGPTGEPPASEEVTATLKGLLRRFADGSRLDSVSDPQ